jgi:hypothetical protein
MNLYCVALKSKILKNIKNELLCFIVTFEVINIVRIYIRKMII